MIDPQFGRPLSRLKSLAGIMAGLLQPSQHIRKLLLDSKAFVSYSSSASLGDIFYAFSDAEPGQSEAELVQVRDAVNRFMGKEKEMREDLSGQNRDDIKSVVSTMK